MKSISLLVILFLSLSFTRAAEPVRVIIIGAHPDDCEYTSGGVAALYSQMGHKVKFVSLTNGNKGHHLMKPDELAARRAKEAQEVARILGVEYEIMNNDDGELLPTLENRFAVIKLICDWKADIVITHRTNDYHPDHRNTGIIVQDAAYMIGVPLMNPKGEPLRKPTVFLYMPDDFQKPNPFSPDIVVDITSVAKQKEEALCANVSQMFEWLPWLEGWDNELPTDPAQLRPFIGERFMSWGKVDKFRKAASKWYSSAQLKNIRYVEAFEICEYGSRPGKEEIKRLFPMLP
jgi:LmbE family N-acetylglucosaminyl deacetylase